MFGTVAATSFIVRSDSTIAAVAPPQRGPVNVTVTTADGTSSVGPAAVYSYVAPVMTGLSPSSGPALGGTSVTVSGSDLTGATKVMFGTVAATSFIVGRDSVINGVGAAL